MSIEGSQRKHKFIVNAMVYAFFSGMSNSFKRKKMLKKTSEQIGSQRTAAFYFPGEKSTIPRNVRGEEKDNSILARSNLPQI